MNAAPDATTPTRKPLPTRRPNFRALRLYSAIWRDEPGDTIFGALLSQRPIELPDGNEARALMFQLMAPAEVVVFDHELEDRYVTMQPVAKVTADDFAIVAVVVRGEALARFCALTEDSDEVQVVELTRADRPGPPRYHATISEKRIPRVQVDPIEIHRLNVAREAAKKANG